MAIVITNGLFLIGLTYKIMATLFVVAFAAVCASAMVLSYLMVS